MVKIKKWYNPSLVIYESNRGSLREAVEEAVALGISLRGADLHDADLNGVIFNGVDLRRVDMSGSNLRGIKARRANFENASLRDANLIGAMLQDSFLGGADLRGAELFRSNITGASFFSEWSGCATINYVQINSIIGLMGFEVENHYNPYSHLRRPPILKKAAPKSVILPVSSNVAYHQHNEEESLHTTRSESQDREARGFNDGTPTKNED